MTLQKIPSFACLAVGVLLPITAFAGSWTGWVSEENGSPPALCASGTEAARGLDCYGGYCDDVRLYCESLPYGITVDSYDFTDFFSEEDDGIGRVTSEGWYRYDNSFSHVCKYAGSAGIVTGIRCSGGNCDNIALECATPRTHFEGVTEPVDFTDCYWTAEYSEEQAAFIAPYGQFITGVECNDSNCDNKSYYVCTAQAAANSCEDSCGGPARGGCFCDEHCTELEDCCSDFDSVC